MKVISLEYFSELTCFILEGRSPFPYHEFSLCGRVKMGSDSPAIEFIYDLKMSMYMKNSDEQPLVIVHISYGCKCGSHTKVYFIGILNRPRNSATFYGVCSF